MSEKKRVVLPLVPEFPDRYMELGERQIWEKGESILRPPPATGVYIMSTGQARLLYHGTEGGQKLTTLLFMINAPAFVYEAIALVGMPANLEAVVTAKAETVFLERETVERLMTDDPAFNAFLVHNIFGKYAQVCRSLIWSRAEVTREALLDVLHEHADECGRRTADGAVRVPIDRTALAEDLGTHPRTLIRWLRTLEEDGDIELWRGGVTLLHPERWKRSVPTRVITTSVGGDAAWNSKRAKAPKGSGRKRRP